MQRQPKEHALPDGGTVIRAAWLIPFSLLMFILMGATSCDEAATQAKARIGEQAIVEEICDVWTPITDTTSPQVRGINRARYAFCES